MAFKTQNILIVIISLVIGGVIGERVKLEARLDGFGDWISNRFGNGSDNLGQGFISASLLFCVGAMAVVGSIQDGLTGDATTLYVKSILDGVMSVVLASTLGAGVGLSAITILAYQGLITIIAGLFGAIFNELLIKEVTAVGGLLIVGIALSMMEIKKINVANLLPAVPVAALLALLWSA
jgi:uncharacterized membrane protein YqgA involved in biofilm formation